MASYPTLRKMRIIEEELGADWKKQHAGKSVDAIYNMVTGDVRKNLFCKISPEIKDKLEEFNNAESCGCFDSMNEAIKEALEWVLGDTDDIYPE